MRTSTDSCAPSAYGLAADAWVLILAGGDGTRLRALTTRLVGDARLKQF